jgi:hypothetical protein
MKTMWTIAAVVLLLACGNSYSEEPATHYYNHLYVRNTTLPPACVELAADSPRKDVFYNKPPTKRPANVPNSYVLVRVFQGGKFLGREYMDAVAVDFLHGAQPTRK